MKWGLRKDKLGKIFTHWKMCVIACREKVKKRVVCPGQGSAPCHHASGITLGHTEKTTGVQSIRGRCKETVIGFSFHGFLKGLLISEPLSLGLSMGMFTYPPKSSRRSLPCSAHGPASGRMHQPGKVRYLLLGGPGGGTKSTRFSWSYCFMEWLKGNCFFLSTLPDAGTS